MVSEILQLKDLETISRTRYKLEQLNLQICKSEIIGILFDSVMDKISFLECIQGESSLVSGRIYIHEKNLAYSEYPAMILGLVEALTADACLIPTLDIADNLFLTKYGAYISNSEKKEKFRNISDEFEISIPMDKQINELSFFEIIILKMIKAYIDGKKIIVISDVIGNLNHTDLDRIEHFIGIFKEKGFSFIVIESIDEEILSRTEHIYYIRKGKTVGIFHNPGEDLAFFKSSYPSISESETESRAFWIDEENPDADAVLSMRHVYAGTVRDLSFIVNRGDSLKLFFNDQKSINDFISIFTENHIDKGKSYLEGDLLEKMAGGDPLKNGIAFINNSLGHSELLFNMSVSDNLGIILSKKMKNVWRRRKYLKSIDHFIDKNIGSGLSDTKVMDLEPEQLIRLIYARWLLYRPKLLFIQNPLSEIDFKLQKTVADMIHLLNLNKISVILLLSNMSSIDKFDCPIVFINSNNINQE